MKSADVFVELKFCQIAIILFMKFLLELFFLCNFAATYIE